MSSTILELNSVTKRFGGIVADNNVSLSIKQGEIVGLVGPNGCGKTTLYNCITGFFPPSEGKIYFFEEDITGKKAYTICQKGIARTFQLIKILPRLTVLENVMAGAFNRTNSTKEARFIAEKTLEFVNLPDLIKMKNSYAENLTTVNKKMLEIIRAFATKPKLIMLDEPMAGLNSSEIKKALNIILKLRDSGITVMIIEHIMEVIMNISDRVIVMVAGKKLTEGLPNEVCMNEQVIKAYLGDQFNVKNK